MTQVTSAVGELKIIPLKNLAELGIVPNELAETVSN